MSKRDECPEGGLYGTTTMQAGFNDMSIKHFIFNIHIRVGAAVSEILGFC